MVQAHCELLPLTKVLLHAAKHPANTVNGVLVGTLQEQQQQPQGEEGRPQQDVNITDAIPLFHSSTNLAGPVEVALAQVEALLQQQSGGLQIVGYYHSDARFGAGDLTPVGRKIADKISAKQPSAVVLLLDNKKLGAFVAGEDAQPFELFSKDGSKGWKREVPGTVRLQGGSSWKALQSEFSSLRRQRLHETICDFDDHLDDAQKDYMNPSLQNLGKMQLPGQQK